MANKPMTPEAWAQITGWLVRMLKYDLPDETQVINNGYWGA